MDVPTEPRITAVDRLENRILVQFDDGKCALFSASLLHNVIPQAQLIDDEDD